MSLEIAGETGASLHVVHVSCAEALRGNRPGETLPARM